MAWWYTCLTSDSSATNSVALFVYVKEERMATITGSASSGKIPYGTGADTIGYTSCATLDASGNSWIGATSLFGYGCNGVTGIPFQVKTVTYGDYTNGILSYGNSIAPAATVTILATVKAVSVLATSHWGSTGYAAASGNLTCGQTFEVGDLTVELTAGGDFRVTNYAGTTGVINLFAVYQRPE